MAITRRLGRTFDRQVKYDPRSLKFTIADHFSTRYKARNRQWNRQHWFDQGTEGACTGFGAGHMLAITPRGFGGITENTCRSIYYEARRQDEWEGEDYEGSSGLGTMRALKAAGAIDRYYWATTIQEIIHGVSHHGPMCIGVNWHAGMRTADQQGYIWPRGSILGGHYALLGGVSMDRRAFRLDNSWGRSWGVDGSAWLTFDSMEFLLNTQGDAVLAKKTRLVDWGIGGR